MSRCKSRFQSHPSQPKFLILNLPKLYPEDDLSVIIFKSLRMSNIFLIASNEFISKNIYCLFGISLNCFARAGHVLFLYNILISRLTARRPLEIVGRKIIQIFGFSLTRDREERSLMKLTIEAPENANDDPNIVFLPVGNIWRIGRIPSL